MTASRDLDRLLRAHFESHADRSVLDGQLNAIADRTARIRQRPGWLAVLRSHTMSATDAIARPTMPRTAWVLVALGLLAVLAVAALAFGGARLTKPTPFNGMIAFGSHDAAKDQTIVHVINPDGTHDRVLRPEPREANFWSPDGEKVGFVDGYVNADGSGLASAPFSNGTLNVPCWDWSPDGESCLAEGWDDTDETRSGLYLVSALNRSSPRQITHRRDLPGVFSPDGSLIAFQPKVGDDQPSSLMIIGVDGRGERVVANLPISGDISWAPDGRSILVLSERRLYRVQLDTGAASPIQIRGEPGADILGGVFSPDGTRILFRRPDASNAIDLFTMRADGTDVVRLTTSSDDEWTIDWGTHPLDN
jgi:hypothetical protein